MQLMQSKRDKTLRVSLNSHWPASYSHTAALHNLRYAKVIVNMNGQCKCLYHGCINATSQSTPLFCQVKKKKKLATSYLISPSYALHVRDAKLVQPSDTMK